MSLPAIEILENLDLSSNPLETLTSFVRNRNYRLLHMGKRLVFLVNEPGLIQWAFTHRSIGRGRFFKVFSRWLGNGLLVSEGEAHRIARRTLIPAFRSSAVDEYMLTVECETISLLDEVPQGEIDLLHWLKYLALQNVIRSIYGLDTLTSGNMNQLLGVLSAGSEMFLGRASIPDGHYYRDGRLRHPVVDEAMSFMFANWRKTPLTQILDNLPEQERFDQTLTLLNASLDTGLAALGWLFHLFGKNPNTFDRAVNEARNGSTHYINLAIHEALRLYPTGGWLNTRETFEGLQINGMDLPAGTNIFISSWVTHRDARFFPDPELFCPERFESQPKPWTYFPFGGGSHKCIGQVFSLEELTYLTATVLQRFDIEFLPQSDVQIKLQIGMTPEGQLLAKVRERAA